MLDLKERIGDWEVDLIIGSEQKGAILHTLTLLCKEDEANTLTNLSDNIDPQNANFDDFSKSDLILIQTKLKSRPIKKS